MHWFVKSTAFQCLSRLPGGQSLYHTAQRRLTGSSRQTDGRLKGKIEQTFKYWEWLVAGTPAAWLREASHLDLGSGWLPSVPMTFHALGISRQYLVDISPHLRPEAVVDTAEMFRSIAPQTGIKFARLPVVPARGLSLEATLEPFGMTYDAPYDELANRIKSTVSFSTATHMLLHLNRPVMLQVFRTVHELLRPGGCFLAQLHLRQLFDGLNSRTSPFFSLRYSEWFWENFINSPMMSYNRLRASDYREILEESGFEVAHFEVEPGRPEDFALLDRARIHPMFARYTRDELAARALFFVARKK
jgi:SAM-dependent methyltransferase